ncbi:lipase [Stylonychia lemnae]|uniref:Lipase n=1 Tax=Stylonychia lemnae TaxID=5949 RepID=A0A078A6I0_STYLE|nr:lipase [Stylonychia lemnae]|eukprot:CDW77185.1 lipase [Stylonychia lemnae]
MKKTLNSTLLKLFVLLNASFLTLADLDRGLTIDFQVWLNKNGYGQYEFAQESFIGGAFGGKDSASDTIVNRPVVFFHGNSDIAVGQPTDKMDWKFGFTKSIEHFMANGYKKSELYVTTWGNGDYTQANKTTHSIEAVKKMRAFMEAVIQYTGASQVDVITHSLGGTLARRVIKGGHVNGAETPYEVGESLAPKVNTLITLAIGNLGIHSCSEMLDQPICNKKNGYYPAGPYQDGPSLYLQELNDNVKEADHVYSLFSTKDEVMSNKDPNFGFRTSMWTTVDDYHQFNTVEFSHLCLRDITAPLQLHLMKNHDMTSFDFNSLDTSGKDCYFYYPEKKSFSVMM